MAVRILLVDDDEIVRDALVMALQARGLEVTALADFGLDTVLRAQADVEPNVVLLDFHLEDTTSSDLIPPLVAAGATVLMLTGSAGTEEISDAVNAAGVHKFLSKHWDAERLTLEVREACRRYKAA